MDKKKMKRIIALLCILVVVAVLAAMPLIAKNNAQEEGPKASILSGTVTTGSLNTELIGGGTLAGEDTQTVSVPSAVKLKQFLVSNGEKVTEGTAIATVDRVSVMKAITQVQETLEYLSQQIEEESNVASKESVNALAGGIVKILYAKEGDSAQKVMLEHGALAVLSLDGLMAVDLQTESRLSAGTTVTVTFTDGKTAAGKISKNLVGEMTVTLEDDGYTAEDTVKVSDQEGNLLGISQLYIYSPWNATAYTGTVTDIKVSVGDKLSAGKTILVLEDVGYSATFRQLIGQRQKYEDLMLELFKMYQTETVTAPCDGIVSGIDKDSVQLLSGNGQGYTLSLLANAPNGDDETAYLNYAGKVTTVANNGWVMQVNPQPIPIADYLDLSGVNLDENLMTQIVLHTQTDIPVFTLTDGVWTQVDRATIGSGDVLLFAADDQGNLVWSVLLQKAASQPENPGGNTQPGVPDTPSGGGRPTGGNFPSGNMGEQEPEFELYGMDVVQIAEVTPRSTMRLEITVDELDMRALQVGMTAQVKINALGGEKCTATVTHIGNIGTNNGGSSKYTVELTMDRTENMLSGMNATATLVLAQTETVLTIPAAALVQRGNETVVYTGYDGETETLHSPVAVKTGCSDGENVEILSGLKDGQTYYYAYYDTLEISYTPDFGGSGFFGR